MSRLLRLRRLAGLRRELGGDTRISLVSVAPRTSRLPGGDVAILKGYGFRVTRAGAQPTVTINGVPATSVLVIDSSTLSFTYPEIEETGVYDIRVQIDTYDALLPKAVSYFGETILSITPAYGPIRGGTRVAIHGVNFDTTIKYQVQFGGEQATDVVVLDDQTILATTPSHELGFADVDLLAPDPMFAPDIFSPDIFNEVEHDPHYYAIFRHGFQFTLLIRGEDMRRNPGVEIQETLGAPPSSCNLVIDGQSNQPVGGEKVEIIDNLDNQRVLWAGTVDTIDQDYEGQVDQLAWKVACLDFTWIANRLRPVGSWFQVSVSQVVKEIIEQFCPGFTTNHVQTNLSKVSVVLDGSLDLITVLNNLAAAIGAGHWYFDYQQDLHFFHVLPEALAAGVPSIIQPPTSGAVDTSRFLHLEAGGAAPFLVSYPAGYYALRCQFVYSDGTHSGLGAWSDVVYFDGSRKWNISNIPIGPAVGDLTVVRRRLWFHRLSAQAGDDLYTVRPYVEIQDNVLTSFMTVYAEQGASSPEVTVFDGGLEIPTEPIVTLGDEWPQPFGPDSNTHGSYSNWAFQVTFIFDDGQESVASPPAFLNAPDDQTHGWNLVIPVGGLGVVSRRVIVKENGVVAWMIVDDNTTTLIQNKTSQPDSFSAFDKVPWGLDYPGSQFSKDVATGRGLPTIPVPDGSNANAPTGPVAPPIAEQSSQIDNDPFVWAASYFSYRYAWLYRDGSVSFASPSSTPIGSQYDKQGFMMVSARIGVQPGPDAGPNNDCIARLVYACDGAPLTAGFQQLPPFSGYPIGYGDGLDGYKLNDPDWSNFVTRGFSVIPDNVTDHMHVVNAPLGADPFPRASVDQGGAYFTTGPADASDFNGPAFSGTFVAPAVEKPVLSATDSFVFTADPVPVWPNADGPYLENAQPPDDLTDDNDRILHQDSGATSFRVTTKRNSVRNRIFVIGAGSTLTANYVPGDLKIFVSDITSFALGGGRGRIEDVSNGNTEFYDYVTLQQQNGVPFVVLKAPLSKAYSQNSVTYNYYRADNTASQKFMAQTELDAFGNPTDGVHEYTITDGSLKTAWQLYMRAQAELEIYAWPIVSITYATTDPNSRIGRTVHADMTWPPCKGDFLIQSVAIDQVHDEGDQLFPRYTVTASNVRYELNDLLLMILGNVGAGTVSATGIASAGAASASSSGIDINESGLPITPVTGKQWGQQIRVQAGGVTVLGTITDFNTTGASSAIIDHAPGVGNVAGKWQRFTPVALNANLCGYDLAVSAPAGFAYWEHRPRYISRVRTGPVLNDLNSPDKKVYWHGIGNTQPTSGSSVLHKPHVAIICDAPSGHRGNWQVSVGNDVGQQIFDLSFLMQQNTVYVLSVEGLDDTHAKCTVIDVTNNTAATLTVPVSGLLSTEIAGDNIGMKAFTYGTAPILTPSASYWDIASQYAEAN